MTFLEFRFVPKEIFYFLNFFFPSLFPFPSHHCFFQFLLLINSLPFPFPFPFLLAVLQKYEKKLQLYFSSFFSLSTNIRDLHFGHIFSWKIPHSSSRQSSLTLSKPTTLQFSTYSTLCFPLWLTADTNQYSLMPLSSSYV